MSRAESSLAQARSRAESASSAARQAHAHASSLAGDPEHAGAYSAAYSAAMEADRQAAEAKSQADAAAAELERARSELQRAEQAHEAAKSAAREAARALADAERAVQAAERAVQEAERAVQAAERAVQEAQRALAEAERAAREAEKAAREAEKAAREAEKAKEAEKAAKQEAAEKAAREAERAAKEAELAAEKAEKAAQEMEKALKEAEKAAEAAEVAAREAQERAQSDSEQQQMQEAMEKMNLEGERNDDRDEAGWEKERRETLDATAKEEAEKKGGEEKGDAAANGESAWEREKRETLDATAKEEAEKKGGTEGGDAAANGDPAWEREKREALEATEKDERDKLAASAPATVSIKTVETVAKEFGCTDDKLRNLDNKVKEFDAAHDRKLQQAPEEKTVQRGLDPIQKLVQDYNKPSTNSYDKVDLLENLKHTTWHSDDGSDTRPAEPSKDDAVCFGNDAGKNTVATHERDGSMEKGYLAKLASLMKGANNFEERKHILEQGSKTKSINSTGTIVQPNKFHNTAGMIKLVSPEAKAAFGSRSLPEQVKNAALQAKLKAYNAAKNCEAKSALLDSPFALPLLAANNGNAAGGPSFRSASKAAPEAGNKAAPEAGNRPLSQPGMDDAHMNPNNLGCEAYNDAVREGRVEDALSVLNFNYSRDNVVPSYTNRVGQKDAAGNKRDNTLVTDTSAEDALLTKSFTVEDVAWKGEQVTTSVENYKRLVREEKMTIGGLQGIIGTWQKYPGWKVIVEKYNINADL